MNHEVKAHMASAHGIGERRKKPSEVKNKMCHLCGTYFTSWKLKKHMEAAHGNNRVACDECGKVLKHPAALAEHKRRHVKVVCTECGETVSEMTYKYHMLSKHTPEDQKPYHCKVCNKGFIKSEALKEHGYIHTGERPYSCDYCARTFGDRSNKLKHMKQAHPAEVAKARLKKKQL